MAGYDITVLGDAELAQAFAELAPRFQARVLRKALPKAADKIKDQAKANANRLTGAMANSITAGETKRRKRGRLLWVIKTGTRKDLGLGDEDFYYPAIVEYGDGETRRPFRFMRRALDGTRQPVMVFLQREIQQGMEREAVLLARRQARAAQRAAATAGSL